MPSLAIRSMLGVRYPIIPFVKMLRFDCPMSSPQMTRMFGFLAGACAAAGGFEMQSATTASVAPAANHLLRRRMVFVSQFFEREGLQGRARLGVYSRLRRLARARPSSSLR